MNSEIILSFISKHLKSVELQLSGFKKDKNIERLHQLRVELKKIRAVLSFIEEIYPAKFELNSLKSLFKKAGKIRDFQMIIEILEHLPLPPQTMVLQLQLKQQSLQQEFIKNTARYLKSVRRFRKETFFDFFIPGKKIVSSYFSDARTKAAAYFNRHNRSEMHDFRKLIKKIMYVYTLLPKHMKNIAELDIELINKLQEEVGSWHDTYSAIAFLSHNVDEKKDDYISMLNHKEASQFANLISKYPVLKI